MPDLSQSVYSQILAHFPADWQPIRCSKSTLVDLSHSIEETFIGHHLRGVLFTGFQESRHWQQEIERYQQISRYAEQVCIFSGHPLPVESLYGEIRITLPDNTPLRQEWFVIALTEHFCCVLAGLDSLAPATHESRRMFDTIWSFDPDVITPIMQMLSLLVEDVRPEKAAHIQQALDHYPPIIPDPVYLTLLTLQFIHHLETQHQVVLDQVEHLDEVVQKRTMDLTVANQQLKQKQEQLVRITDNMQDVICLIDAQGNIQYITPSALNVLGYTVESLIGSPIFSGVYPEDLLQMQLNIRQGNRAEYRYRHQNGQYIWLETLSRLVSEPADSASSGAILNIRNISKRKAAEQALQYSEERFRQLAENIDDVLWIRSLEHEDYLYVNLAYEKIWGRSVNSVYQNGSSILDTIHPADRQRVALTMSDVLIVNGYDEEYRIVKPDGIVRWIHTRVFPIRNAAGATYRLAGVSADITDQKNLEHNLQDINRLKTDFLTTAAHELRTPLTTIKGFTELLLSRPFDENRRTRYLTLMNEQSGILAQIIDDLLDVSRLEANRSIMLKLELLQIDDLLQKTITPFIELGILHQININASVNLPSCIGDIVRIGEVIKNLISNAIKYSPQGGTIAVSADVVEDDLQVSIQDNGIGMTVEQQSHLFEKFYRADASNVAISGTGLGLAISKLIIELHGGKIWAKSEYRVGSTFYFTLPLSRPYASTGRISGI